MGNNLDLHVDPDLAYPGDLADAIGQFASNPVDHAQGRIAQHDFQGHLTAVDADIAGFLAGDVILADSRIDERLECRLDLLFGDRHARRLGIGGPNFIPNLRSVKGFCGVHLLESPLFRPFRK